MTEQLTEAFNRIAGAFEEYAAAQQRLADVAEAAEQRISERAKQSKALASDEHEAEAIAFLKANSTLSGDHVVAGLRAKGITRNRAWVLSQRYALGLPTGRRKRPAPPTAKPFNHKGLKIHSRDDRDFTLGDVPASEIPEREAFAIEAIRQNPQATTADLCWYIQEHQKCGLERDFAWIDSHRVRTSAPLRNKKEE